MHERASVLLGLVAAVTLASSAAGGSAVVGADSSGYQELLRLFHEWRALQKPKFNDGVPDYTAAAMERQRRDLRMLQARLRAIDPASWSIPEQIDYHLVRAEMNGLDFDHRVLRPWSRNPCFYSVLWESQSDTPAHEGHAQAGAIELWQYSFPASPEAQAALKRQLRAVPSLLEQARVNLVEDARDLWLLGVRIKKSESTLLARLRGTLSAHHPDLVPEVERAQAAVEGFRAWLEASLPGMSAPSGIGIADYDWYLKNVHLSPYTWEDERRLHEREWARARAHLGLQENLNRVLPPLAPIASAEDYHRQFGEAVTEYVRFLAEEQVLTLRPYMDQALREREGRFEPAEARDFFSQVEHRDPIVMRTHGFHWLDLARMEREPHQSPIRRGPLLYNIWDSRAEGLATAMEEMMMTAGLLEGRPRAKELIYTLVANRAARGLAALRQHSRELTLEQALRAAHEDTPHGWLREQGETNWAEQRLYLEQPGYGSCYLAGKAQIEKLLADRSAQLGERFRLKRFMDELAGAGMIPVSLIRWEMTGRDDEVRRIFR